MNVEEFIKDETTREIQVDWNVWKEPIDKALGEIDWTTARDVGASLNFNYSYFLGIREDPDQINELRLYKIIKERVELLARAFYTQDPPKEIVDGIGCWKIKLSLNPEPKVHIGFVVTESEN